MTAAFRAVIHVHYKPLDAIQPRLVFLPPQLNTIHHEVACFTALCEKEKRAAGCHFQYSAVRQFRFGYHVVVGRGHLVAGHANACPMIKTYVDHGLRIEADPSTFPIGVSQRVFIFHILEGSVGPCRFWDLLFFHAPEPIVETV